MGGRILLLGFGLLVVIGSWFVTCQLWNYREIAAGVVWLEPKNYEGLTAITIGTGAAGANPGRRGPVTGIALGDTLALIDAGHGVGEALRGVEIPLRQPQAILLTSLIPENTIGLDNLIVGGWLDGRTTPLHVVGPPGTKVLVDALLEAHRVAAEGINNQEVVREVLAQDIDAAHADGWQLELSGELRVTAQGVGKAQSNSQLAYRFASGAKSIIVSGSGPDLDALEAFSKEAWVLVAEGFLRDSVEMAIEAGGDASGELAREIEAHNDLSEIAGVAERASVLALIVTRLRPPPLFDSQYEAPIEDRFNGRVVIAHDGNEFRP